MGEDQTEDTVPPLAKTRYVPSAPKTTSTIVPTDESPMFLAWLLFWLVVWIGTTLAGGSFGAGIGVIVLLTRLDQGGGDAALIFQAPLFGLVYAGVVGFFVIPTVGTLCWMFWQQKRPFVLAFLTGCLIGGLGGFVLFFITGPLGGVGAVLAVKAYMRSSYGMLILGAEEVRREKKYRGTAPHFSYSISDLLWRMTAVGALIAFWSVLIRFGLQMLDWLNSF